MTLALLVAIATSISYDTCVDRRSAFSTSNCCSSQQPTLPMWAGHTCNITNFYAEKNISIRAWYVFDATGRTYHLQFTNPFPGNALENPQLALDASEGESLSLADAAWAGYKVYPVSDREVIGTWETCDDAHPQNACGFFDGYINLGVRFVPDGHGGVSSFVYPYGAPLLSSTNLTILEFGLWPTGMYADPTVFATGQTYAIRDPFHFATAQTRACYRH